ncbi:hypothetical protein, partial [Aquariibacter albus]
VSPSLRIARIWLSVILDFLIALPRRCGSLHFQVVYSAGELTGRHGTQQLASYPAAQGRVERRAELARLGPGRRSALRGHRLGARSAIRATQRRVAGEPAADRAGAAPHLSRYGTAAQPLLGKKAKLGALLQAQARLSSGHVCKSLKLLDVLDINFDSALQESSNTRRVLHFRIETATSV